MVSIKSEIVSIYDGVTDHIREGGGEWVIWYEFDPSVHKAGYSELYEEGGLGWINRGRVGFLKVWRPEDPQFTASARADGLGLDVQESIAAEVPAQHMQALLGERWNDFENRTLDRFRMPDGVLFEVLLYKISGRVGVYNEYMIHVEGQVLQAEDVVLDL